MQLLLLFLHILIKEHLDVLKSKNKHIHQRLRLSTTCLMPDVYLCGSTDTRAPHCPLLADYRKTTSSAFAKSLKYRNLFKTSLWQGARVLVFGSVRFNHIWLFMKVVKLSMTYDSCGKDTAVTLLSVRSSCRSPAGFSSVGTSSRSTLRASHLIKSQNIFKIKV